MTTACEAREDHPVVLFDQLSFVTKGGGTLDGFSISAEPCLLLPLAFLPHLILIELIMNVGKMSSLPS